MKKEFDLVIVIPIGPGTELDFIIDTIDSIYYYVASSFQIIIADDSMQGLGGQVKKQFPSADVITTIKNNGRYGGLYVTLSLAYRHAVENYHFKALFKVDTDALIIGNAPEKDVIDLFANHSDAGMAGQYGRQYNDEPWNIAWPRQRILNSATTWKFIRRPVANWILRTLYKKAIVNGYKTGESVFGGSYFMSESCLKKLYDEGWLPEKRLHNVYLEEDHIFTLLAKAAGFNLYDLSEGNLPFGCTWKGLPDSPENLLKNGKRIIHSTRYWNDLKENQIRQYFRGQRE